MVTRRLVTDLPFSPKSAPRSLWEKVATDTSGSYEQKVMASPAAGLHSLQIERAAFESGQPLSCRDLTDLRQLKRNGD